MSSWLNRLLSWKRNTQPSREAASSLLARSRLIVDKPGRFDDANACAHEVARIAYLSEGLLRFEAIDCTVDANRVSGRMWTPGGPIPFTIYWQHVQELLRELNVLLDQSDSDERYARFVGGGTSGVMFAPPWEVRRLRREGVLFPAFDMN